MLVSHERENFGPRRDALELCVRRALWIWKGSVLGERDLQLGAYVLHPQTVANPDSSRNRPCWLRERPTHLWRTCCPTEGPCSSQTNSTDTSMTTTFWCKTVGRASDVAWQTVIRRSSHPSTACTCQQYRYPQLLQNTSNIATLRRKATTPHTTFQT